MKTLSLQKTGLIMLMSLIFFSASAYDFEVDGLCYNILSNNKKTVKLTCKVDGSANENYVLGDLTIPQSVEYSGNIYAVTEIGDKSFYYCKGLTSVNIPSTITNIGRYAFYNCSGLTSVTIPNSVINIYEAAFRECSGLMSITLGNSVNLIGYGAFCLCTSLTSIEIPNSVYYLDQIAFASCTKLTSVSIGDSVSYIGQSAFSDCIALTSITFGNSVTTIGEYAFDGCIGLTSITIPSPIETIDREAFRNCTGLTSVSIGNSVNSIGLGAFIGCNTLSKIYCTPETPPSAYYNPFDFPQLDNTLLYVPIGSLSAYQGTDPWKKFKNIEEIGYSSVESVYDKKMTIYVQDNIVTVAGVSEDAFVVIFDMNGCIVVNARGNFSTNLPNGVYVLCSVGKTVKFKI